jgi:phosphoribosylanthranilate isomerase
VTDSTPFVKICCIKSVAQAEVAIDSGASALGLVSRMPSGPGVISETLITAIAAQVAGRVETVLLTSETEPAAIVEQANRTGVSGIQLCAWLDDEAREDLRRRLPEIMLMQVVHVIDERAVERAIHAQEHMDRLLLDSGNLTGPRRELGGTGRTHDWDLSRTIVRNIDLPVLLAGGLDARNAAAAMDAVGPFGLDVCSGVRQDGRLDNHRLSAFFNAVREDRAHTD